MFKLNIILLFLFFGVFTGFAGPGDLDLTFNRVGYSVGLGSGGDAAFASVVQPDGKIILVGVSSSGISYFAVARYLPNGMPDTTFNGTGKVLTSFGTDRNSAHAVALQADGKIVVAGQTTYRDPQPNSYSLRADFAVCRYNPDGSLDRTFDGDGKVRTAFGSIDVAYSVSIGSDGKIVVGGRGGEGNIFGMTFARYNPDGSLDSSFDRDGKLVSAIGSSASSVAVQPDGKIVASGTGQNGVYEFTTVRLNVDGSLDESFNGTGLAPAPSHSGHCFAYSVGLQPDGKIVVAGQWEIFGRIAVIRYKPDGTFDESFGSGGARFIDFANSVEFAIDMDIQPDGKIVLATSGSAGRADFKVFRLNPNGASDTSFNGTGSLSASVGNGQSVGTGAVIQSDGRIVVTGYLGIASGEDFAMARFLANGTPDTGFGSGGKTITNLSYGAGTSRAVVLQPDGKAVVVGGPEVFTVARYKIDGSLDESFNNTGYFSTPIGSGSSASAKSVVVQDDGKIVAGGDFLTAQNRRKWVVARFNADGSLDPSFGSMGWITNTQIDPFEETFSEIALQPDGKVLVAGTGGPQAGPYNLEVVRYNADGSLDTGFARGGKLVDRPCDGKSATALSIALQPDGRIVLSGSCGSVNKFMVFRYNANGSRDTTFNKTGVAVMQAELGAEASDVLVQKDGRIAFAGTVLDQVTGRVKIALGRFTGDGQPDTSFNGTGFAVKEISYESLGIGIAIQDDGKILLTAQTGNMNQSYVGYVLRYTADGSLDPQWGRDGVSKVALDGNCFPGQIVIDDHGRAVLAGYLQGSFGIARLQGDESLVPVSVSGRVTAADGRWIAGANVSMTDPDGVVRTVQTNPFGYYRFENVQNGTVYTISVSAKGYRFSPRTVTVGGELTDLDFVPNS